MVGYIYKIENLKTHQCYIGQTINLSQRRARHFRTLKDNVHDNPKLQASWNKYGEDNFSFEYWSFNDITHEELDRLECEYIEKYNGLSEGFNLIPGGTKPPLHKKVKDEDIITFLCVQEILGDGYGKTCEKIFEWSKGTASRIKRKLGYLEVLEKFNELTKEQKEEIGKSFIESQKLKDVSLKRQMAQGGCEKAYNLTKEDFYFAFAAQELGYNYTSVANYIGIKPATVKDWFNGRSRAKEKKEYLSLAEGLKKEIKNKVQNVHLSTYDALRLENKNSEDIIAFLCYDLYYPQNDTNIQKYFNWSEGTCYGMRKKDRYLVLKERVAIMTEEEKKKVANKLKNELAVVK